MKQSLHLLSFILLSFASCSQSNSESIHQDSKQELTKPKASEISLMSTHTENQTQDPESIVKSLIAAMAAKDAEKIRSLFDENASQAYGNSPAKSGKAFFSWLESDIIDREGHVDKASFETNDAEVVVKGQYSSRGYTNKANFLFKVENGKIVSWQMRY